MMNPYSVAQETLGMSSMQRGLGGMTSPVRPGPNAYDGVSSAAAENVQSYSNQRLADQNTLQNIGSAAPQAASNAMGQVRSQTAAQSDQEAKAQMLLNERMSEALYANQSGARLMDFNAVIQSPEKYQFLHNIAAGKALADGMSFDLAGEVTAKNQYM